MILSYTYFSRNSVLGTRYSELKITFNDLNYFCTPRAITHRDIIAHMIFDITWTPSQTSIEASTMRTLCGMKCQFHGQLYPPCPDQFVRTEKFYFSLENSQLPSGWFSSVMYITNVSLHLNGKILAIWREIRCRIFR